MLHVGITHIKRILSFVKNENMKFIKQVIKELLMDIDDRAEEVYS